MFNKCDNINYNNIDNNKNTFLMKSIANNNTYDIVIELINKSNINYNHLNCDNNNIITLLLKYIRLEFIPKLFEKNNSINFNLMSDYELSELLLFTTENNNKKISKKNNRYNKCVL